MTDNLSSQPRKNKKDYLIVFGDVGQFVEYAKVPPSHSLKIIPLAEKLRKQTNSAGDTLTEILTEAQRPTMLFLFAFFKDFEEMKKCCDEDPNMFMMADIDDLDEEEDALGHRVFGVGRELYSIEMDVAQAAARYELDMLRFPDAWEIVKAPLLLRTGEVKSVDHGFSGMLDKRVLNTQIFNWANTLNLPFESFGDLPHVNWSTVQLLNVEALQKDPNATFTVYCKKEKATKRPVLKAV